MSSREKKVFSHRRRIKMLGVGVRRVMMAETSGSPSRWWWFFVIGAKVQVRYCDITAMDLFFSFSFPPFLFLVSCSCPAGPTDTPCQSCYFSKTEKEIQRRKWHRVGRGRIISSDLRYRDISDSLCARRRLFLKRSGWSSQPAQRQREHNLRILCHGLAAGYRNTTPAWTNDATRRGGGRGVCVWMTTSRLTDRVLWLTKLRNRRGVKNSK